MRSWVWLVGLVAIASACGSGELGFACDDSDRCADGLTCIATEAERPDDDGDLACQDAGSFCSVACEIDEDCVAELGEGHICVLDCGIGACFVGSRG